MTERERSGPVDADRRLNRRSFLAVASAGAAAAVPFVRGAGKEDRDGRTTGTDGFDPTRHGFGFHNWRIQQGPYPGVEGSDPEGEFVERWDAPFRRAFDSPLTSMPGRLREALAEHAREGLLEATRTNGYCYGMVFAAQQYFERPGTIPSGFEHASEIEHPEAPLSTPETPVLDDVVDYHTAQYLDFYAWFGRYGLMKPDWIDYDEQLREITAALDHYGTAGVTLVSRTAARSHQVLAHDYERGPDGVSIAVYDPNYPAATYDAWTPTIEIDTSGVEPAVEPISLGEGYSDFVHNQYDRRIRSGYGDRSPSLTSRPGALDRVLGRTLFVEVEGPVRTAIVDPRGRPVDRTRGDRTIHYRYGAVGGTYRIRVTGETAGAYSIDVYAGGHRGDLLEDATRASIEAGETHRYDLALAPEGTLERV